MAKKITNQEREDRIVSKVVKAIENLETRFPQQLLERGIMKYKNNKAISRKLKKEISDREAELEKLKQKSKR
jgi:hypothetical protein